MTPRSNTKGFTPAGKKRAPASSDRPDKIELTVDLDALTWDELDEIEAIVGRRIGSELATGDLSTRTMRALIVFARRKEDPTFELKGTDKVTDVFLEVRGTAPDPTQRSAGG